MRNYKFIFFATAFLLSQAACKNELRTPEIEPSQLTGRWELSKAYRNGKETETMTGTFYEFIEGQVRTNFTPSAQEGEFPYQLAGNQLTQGSEPPVVYTIDSLDASFLVFSLSINNFPFRLELTKVAASTEPALPDSTQAAEAEQL